MCLPVGCLKACVGLATVITLALGVISIACSATIGTNNLFISTVKETKLVVMYLLIVFGAMLIILAITGIIGVCKKSSCCLTIYNIGIVIFFLIFMAVGIASLALFDRYKVQNINDYDSCSTTNWLKDANEYAEMAKNYLCHSPCACDWPSAENYDKNGSKRVQDCKGFSSDFSGFSDYFVALELIEDEFNCAGICKKSDYYLFTDVMKGSPPQACAPKIQDYLDTYSKRIGAASIVIAVVLFLILVCSCCFCCHPDKKHERNVYQRMM